MAQELSKKIANGDFSEKEKGRKNLLDGHEIPNLVKQKKSKRRAIETDQDEYILKKLFSKSGIETALKHDKIVDSDVSDYALLEAEAEKVAKDAVKALKESRRECRPPPKPRFKASKINPTVAMENDELMARIRERNRLDPDMNVTPLEEHSDLLVDIRNFVAFGAVNDNNASTKEIIDKFRDRLPAGKSPLFKALLNQICDFSRDTHGRGVWNLKPEFSW